MDHLQQRCPLHQLDADTAQETLGVYLAPDGNERTQIRHLKSKIDTWVERVRTKHISRHHAILALNSTILKTLEYPLPALTISKQQWTKIMAPLIQCGLQAGGICSKIPKVIRQGSKQHMALQVKCMSLTQEIHKLDKYLMF